MKTIAFTSGLKAAVIDDSLDTQIPASDAAYEHVKDRKSDTEIVVVRVESALAILMAAEARRMGLKEITLKRVTDNGGWVAVE